MSKLMNLLFNSEYQYRIGSGALLIFCLFWIWISAANPGESFKKSIEAPQKGFLAPEFNLQSNNDNNVALSDFQGQPVIVNIWASWCGPCRAEMPALERVFKAYSDQGLVVLAVNSTFQDSKDSALAFVEEHGLTFPILFDETGEVSNLYRVQALPSTFFVDPDGKIQEVVIGGPMAEALLRTRVLNLFQETR